MDTKRVVAALIWKDDKLLICQRPSNKLNPLLWEFVGGKVEENETDEEALKREINEELGLKVIPTRFLYQLHHDYPELSIDLALYEAQIESGEPTLKEHNDIKWIDPSEISNYDFCAADKEILELLKRGNWKPKK